jgi:predicted RNA-binding protein with PUA-like domain
MAKARYFLAKSEPDVYSIDDLARDQRTTWDGVRNAQARMAIQAMRPGDLVFIYHSGGVSAVVGVARVISQPVDAPDDPKMTVVDLEYLHTLTEPVSLKTIKESGLFAEFALVRQSRLSTMEAPVAFAAWLKKQRPELKKVLA